MVKADEITKDIAALLDEPACEHNKKEKVRLRPNPNRRLLQAACALTGRRFPATYCGCRTYRPRAYRLLRAVPGQPGHAVFRGGFISHRMTTDLTEQDIVMGRSEKRLFHAIKQAIDTYHHRPPYLFITPAFLPWSAMTSMRCAVRPGALGRTVVPIDSAGFYGTKNSG